MSDVVVPAKVLVPKGWKKCPKCKELVKGPRTSVCPECKQDISKPGKPAKPVKAKGTGKPGRPRKVAIAVAKPTPTDPYTFHVNAVGDYMGVKGAMVVRNANGSARFPKGLQSTLDYLTTITPPPAVVFPTVVETVKP